MCELCALNESKDGFILTLCRTCGTVLIVGREHRAEFTEGEKDKIRAMFDNVRWDMRQILDHAHCHLVPFDRARPD